MKNNSLTNGAEALDRFAPWLRGFRELATRTLDLANGLHSESHLKEKQRGEEIRRILVPTDFSPCSARAVAEAVKLARQCDASLTLLYVVDLERHTAPVGPTDAGKLRKDLWEQGVAQLGQTILGLVGKRVEAQTLLVEGLPAETIADVAQRYDLIVIGEGKPKPFWQLFSRRTVGAVLDQAPCPVLVVQEQDPGEHSEN